MGLRYTKLKVFYFPEKLASLPRERAEVLPPLHIRLKPTNVCNHRCSYCAYRSPDLQLGQDMNVRDFIPREKMLEIVEDLGEMGVKAVTFSGGGDPFCYPYLLETAQRMDAAGIQFACLTNGSNLSGETADFFAKRAAWLRVSLDGWDDESYAAYRGVRVGEFSKVIQNLRDFNARGGACGLSVVLIVDHKNAPHVYDTIKLLAGIGVSSIKVSGCVISNDGAANNEYHRPFFGLVKQQINSARSEFAALEIFDAYHELENNFAKDYDWCPYLQILTVIGADLNVYSCQDKAYNLENGLLGSIKDRRFKDFWLESKETFFKIKPCRDCNHHCVSNSKNKMLLEFFGADKEHLGFV